MARPRPELGGSIQTTPKPGRTVRPEPVEGPAPLEEPEHTPPKPRLVRRFARSHQADNPAAEVSGAKYRTIGSLIGRLGQVEVADRREFRLYDQHTDWATPVTHAPEHRGTLTDALGKTVIVSGQLWRGANRKPLRLAFRKLRVIDFDNRRSLDDLIGIAPDFTGGLSSEEYVRRLRNDD